MLSYKTTHDYDRTILLIFPTSQLLNLFIFFSAVWDVGLLLTSKLTTSDEPNG